MVLYQNAAITVISILVSSKNYNCYGFSLLRNHAKTLQIHFSVFNSMEIF